MAIPPPMVPAPMIAALRRGYGCSVFRDIRHLRDGAFGDEGVDERAGLFGGEGFGGELALLFAAFLKRSVAAASSASRAISGRGLVAAGLARKFAGGGESGGVGFGRAEFLAFGRASGCAARRHLLRERDRGGQQIAF